MSGTGSEAAAADETHPCPEEVSTAPASPDISMFSALSDSRASTPAPVSPAAAAAMWADSAIGQQQQQPDMPASATEAPAIVASEIAQFLYWRSLQQQQQQQCSPEQLHIPAPASTVAAQVAQHFEGPTPPPAAAAQSSSQSSAHHATSQSAPGAANIMTGQKASLHAQASSAWQAETGMPDARSKLLTDSLMHHTSGHMHTTCSPSDTSAQLLVGGMLDLASLSGYGHPPSTYGSPQHAQAGAVYQQPCDEGHGYSNSSAQDVAPRTAAAAYYARLDKSAQHVHPSMAAMVAAEHATHPMLSAHFLAGIPSAALQRELTFNPLASGTAQAAGHGQAASSAAGVVPGSAQARAGSARPIPAEFFLQDMHSTAQAPARADRTPPLGFNMQTQAVAPHTLQPVTTMHQQFHHARAHGAPTTTEAFSYGRFGFGTPQAGTASGSFVTAGSSQASNSWAATDHSHAAAHSSVSADRATAEAAAAVSATKPGVLTATTQQQQQQHLQAYWISMMAQAAASTMHGVLPTPQALPPHAAVPGRTSAQAEQDDMQASAAWSPGAHPSPFAAYTGMPAAGGTFNGGQQHSTAAPLAAAATPQALYGMQQLGFLPPGFPSGSTVTAQQQQLDQLLRLQQLQLLQWQLQAAATSGQYAPALHAAPLLGLWGMPVQPGTLHPLLQHSHQLAAAVQQGHAAAAVNRQPLTSTEQAAGVDGSAGCMTNTTTSHTLNTAQQTLQHDRAEGLPAAAPPAAVEGTDRGLSRSSSIMAHLRQWLPLPSRRCSSSSTALPAQQSHTQLTAASRAALQTHPQQVTTIVAAGTTAATGMHSAVVTDTGATATGWGLDKASVLEYAAVPFAGPLVVVVGAGSLALQGWCSMGRTAASTVHTIALACVTASQYQLLMLLCCLAAAAAAAEAAGFAVSAAVAACRSLLWLAARESRLFVRAAAVVVFTDMKQLCVLLATQPLVLLPGSAKLLLHRRATQGHSRTPNADAGAEGSGRLLTESCTLSRRATATHAPISRSSLSQVLGSLMLGARTHGSCSVTPRSSTNSSRRSSIHFEPSSLLAHHSLHDTAAPTSAASEWGAAAAAAGGTGLESAAASQHAEAASGTVSGLTAGRLVVYDSLAVVAGLWSGLALRLWTLLLLQAPLGGCRIWLQAISTACRMSAVAAGAAARTALQTTWYLAHLSLVLLGCARCAGTADMTRTHNGVPACSSTAGAAAAAGTVPDTAGTVVRATMKPGSAATAAWKLLHWWWLHIVTAAAAVVPAGGMIQGMISKFGVAQAAIAGLGSAFSNTMRWLEAAWRHKVALMSRAGRRDIAVKGLHLLGLLMVWFASCMMGLMERCAVLAADRMLRDAPPVARAAVYGSARMIRGLVVEAGRQSGMLAAQLLCAWQATEGAAA